MEILRDCQSPLEMSLLDGVNSKEGRKSSEKQAMIPINFNDHSANNNHARPVVSGKSAVAFYGNHLI